MNEIYDGINIIIAHISFSVMTDINPGNPFSQKSNANRIYNRGFRPELYTVANGTYSSNAVYGVGEDLLNSYLNVQLPRGTTTVPLIGASGPPFVPSTEGCDIRQNGKNVEFVCSVVLDGNPLTEPSFGNEELRIRPQQVSFVRPARYMIPLPLSDRNLDEPVFDDVEIQDKSGVQIAPDATAGAGAWILQARLLRDGTLALVKKDVSIVGTQQTALLHSDINAGFSADNSINITIRGSYRAAIPL